MLFNDELLQADYSMQINTRDFSKIVGHQNDF
jgi:hypothetical protein